MKKLIAIAAFMVALITGVAHAQYTGFTMVNVRPSGTVVARDTTSNTDTSYLYVTTNASGLTTTDIKYNNDVVVRWTNTQVSGTSGGYVIFQGSMTGTFANTTADWVTLLNDDQYSIVTDSVTVSGTTVGTFIIPDCKWRYVRARYISSGTQTSALVGTAWIRPRS